MKANNNTKINLFWGGRTHNSADIYDAVLNRLPSRYQNGIVHKCYSREEQRQYVQDLIIDKKEIVLDTIDNNGTIMICGSLAMQHDILDVLESLLNGHNIIRLDELQHNGQLRMDCY